MSETGSKVIYNRVALIGLGLIAGSMSLAMRRAGVAGEITGYARSQATRETAREIGLVDRVCDTAAEAVADADLIVLAVPVGAMGPVMQEIESVLKPGAVVTDVGSVKKSVLDAVMPHIPEGVQFIGTHPMAGTEHSGPRSGFAELFDNRWCLIVPPEGADEGEVKKLEDFWAELGATTERMDPEHHDTVCAVVSHVPHLIAYTMVGVADDLRRVTDQEVIKFSAAGFRDFTRIAASDPTMWRDVFLTNKDAALEILGRFTEELFALQRAIRTGDGDTLHDYFTRTRAIRRGIIEAGQDTDAPDFGRVKKGG
ncbi:prephenate/arogenate dehydrogenase family protein [Celeribacter sp.]|uniref:prephenate/arogenate dehydrogenase family protein n=1 Tax=Celeribacter sp. TaxID=1890673 RepID=UPI003A93E868